jgi:O-antigen/teichoic acid export membrane protein
MDFRRQLVIGLRWLTVGRLLGQGFSWASTIIVVRLLDPSDYGVMAMAMAVIGLFGLVNDLGLGAALVHQASLDRRIVREVFGATTLLSLAAFMALQFAAPLAASFFGEPSLTAVLRAVSVPLIWASVGTVHAAILSWRMDFKGRSVADFLQLFIASLVTLGVAWRGHGVWALVGGHIVGQAVWAAVCVLRSRYWCLPSFTFGASRHRLYAFGTYLTLERTLWYLYSQSDSLIVGRRLGDVVLGYYSVALQIATLPMDKISGILNTISFAAFSRLQHDHARAGAYLQRSLRLIGLLAFPVCFGLSAVSNELVDVFLGSKWRGAAVPLGLLSLTVPLRLLAAQLSPAIQGIGQPRIALRNLVIISAIMPVAFVLGSNWGLEGVVYAWVLIYPLLFVVTMRLTLPLLNLQLGGILRLLYPCILSATAMWLSVRWLRAIVDASSSTTLFVSVSAGALVYAAMLAVLDRNALLELREALTVS